MAAMECVGSLRDLVHMASSIAQHELLVWLDILPEFVLLSTWLPAFILPKKMCCQTANYIQIILLKPYIIEEEIIEVYSLTHYSINTSFKTSLYPH